MIKIEGLVHQRRQDSEALISCLDSGHTDSAMSQPGLRAMKWLLSSKDVNIAMTIIKAQPFLLSQLTQRKSNIVYHMYIVEPNYVCRTSVLAIRESVKRLDSSICCSSDRRPARNDLSLTHSTASHLSDQQLQIK